MNRALVVVEKKDGEFGKGSHFIINQAVEMTESMGIKLNVAVLCDKQSLEVRAYSEALTEMIEKEGIGLCVLPASQFGNELASMTVAIMEDRWEKQVGLICDATGIWWNENEKKLQVKRLSTDGTTEDTYILNSMTMQIVTLKIQQNKVEAQTIEGVFLKPIMVSGEPIIREETVEMKQMDSIEDAEVVFSAGRGIGGEEGLRKLEKLARLFGAQTATSRTNVDDGLVSKEKQVGFSGKIIAPKLYFALGISGSAHHMIGVEQAETIIAVNWDRNAPIFDAADLGIVADLNQIMDMIEKKITIQ